MSIVRGGIYGDPLGKTGAIVWGKARTYYGKEPTTRRYVIPHDPQTVDQVERRDIFRMAVNVAKFAGSALWQNAWNDTLGELPGWHSFLSWAIENLEPGALEIDWTATPSEKLLGPVYMPSVSTTGASSGQVKLTWTSEVPGDHASADDLLFGFVSKQDQPDLESSFKRNTSGTLRSALTYSFTGVVPGEDYLYCVWFRHEEPDESYTYSLARTGIATAGA